MVRCLSCAAAGGVVRLWRTGGDQAEAARGDLRRRACVSVDVCVCARERMEKGVEPARTHLMDALRVQVCAQSEEA